MRIFLIEAKTRKEMRVLAPKGAEKWVPWEGGGIAFSVEDADHNIERERSSFPNTKFRLREFMRLAGDVL